MSAYLCTHQYQSLGVWRVLRRPVFLASGALWGSAEVFQAQASPDGRWLAVAKDDGVRLLELQAGQERAFAAVPRTRAACFLPDGAALGVASTGGLSIHPITSGGALEPGRACLVPGLEAVRQLAMSDDGRWCAEAAFDAVTIRNTDSWATHFRVPRQLAELGLDWEGP